MACFFEFMLEEPGAFKFAFLIVCVLSYCVVTGSDV